MKKIKIIGLFSILLLGLITIPCKTINTLAESETWDYECDFSDLEIVNKDFKAYYLTKFMGGLNTESVTLEKDSKSHWYLDNNSVRRANDIGTNYNADSLSMLYFTKDTYSNFKMQIDIYQGTTTSFWSALNLRVTTLGKHTFEDGCMFYSEWDGTYNAWGDGLHGGPFDLGKLENYSQSKWYTYTITMDGNMMHVNAIDRETKEQACDFDVKLQWKYYQEGYVSFLSINNDSGYANFKIKKLPITEDITSNFDRDQKISSSTSDNSLDVLASDTKSGDINDLVEVKEKEVVEESEKGCKGNSSSTIIGLLGLILLLFRGKKYGKV